MAPTYNIPVPQGSVTSLGISLQEGEHPIVLGIDKHSRLRRTPIKRGFKLIAIELGNGITFDNVNTEEVIHIMREHARDSRRKLIFHGGNHLNRLTETSEKHPMAYWETDLVEWFEYYDVDDSGALSQKEVIDALVDTFGVPQNRKKIADVVKTYWRRSDFDSSGFIELNEFCSPDGFGEKLRKVIHMYLTKDVPEKPSLKYWKNSIAKWFHYYDVDGSGHLSQQEIIDGMVDTFSAPQRREKIVAVVEKYWATFDFDENGLITMEEFCDEHGFGDTLREVIQTVIEQRSKKKLQAKPTLEYWEKNLWQWFDFYDQDYNGFLSQEEVIDGFIDAFSVPQNRAKVTHVIKTYWDRNDFDQDGYISREEFCDEKGFGKKLKKAIQRKLETIGKQKKVEINFVPELWQDDLGAWFDHYDIDCSNTLSKAEVVAALIETFPAKDSEQKKSIKSTVMDTWFLYDLDDNQVIDRDEFLLPNGLAETLQAELRAKMPQDDGNTCHYSYDRISNSVTVSVPAGHLGFALKNIRPGVPAIIKLKRDSPLQHTPVKIGFRLVAIELGNGVTYTKLDADRCIQLLNKSIDDIGRKLVFQGGSSARNDWS